MAVLVRVAPIAYVMLNRYPFRLYTLTNSLSPEIYTKLRILICILCLFRCSSATVVQSSSVLNAVPVGIGLDLSTSYHDRYTSKEL